jgi:hypothetical protein
MMGGATVLPEFGPPDVPAPNIDPALELPDSNIGEGEWRRAVERERALAGAAALIGRLMPRALDKSP